MISSSISVNEDRNRLNGEKRKDILGRDAFSSPTESSPAASASADLSDHKFLHLINSGGGWVLNLFVSCPALINVPLEVGFCLSSGYGFGEIDQSWIPILDRIWLRMILLKGF